MTDHTLYKNAADTHTIATRDEHRRWLPPVDLHPMAAELVAWMASGPGGAS